jgi:hypothetical protein
MVTVPRPRGMLREFLEYQLKLRREPPPASAYLERCLHQALEGLHALGHGEATPIFTPKKTKDHGVTPYSAKKFRMKAVGFVDLLYNKGRSKTKAKATVAKAYGVSGDTIKDWQQDEDLGKTSDPWMQHFRQEIAHSTHLSHARIREALSEAAEQYVIANKKKKAKTAPVKKPSKNKGTMASRRAEPRNPLEHLCSKHAIQRT